MSRRIGLKLMAICLLWLLAVACGKEYQCQVLCRTPAGSLEPSSDTLKVRGSSLQAAQDNCVSEANQKASCQYGAVAEGCSCWDPAGQTAERAAWPEESQAQAVWLRGP